MNAVLVNELYAAGQLIAKADEGSPAWLLLAGPFAGGGLYWALWRFYRNTDKSHQFERTTRVEAKPVVSNDTKVNQLKRTKKDGIPGNNRGSHRSRVQRVD